MKPFTYTSSLGPLGALVGIGAALINITFIVEEMETQVRIRQQDLNLNMRVCQVHVMKWILIQQGCRHADSASVTSPQQLTWD